MNTTTNFSTYFAAWRDAIEQNLNPAFQHTRNVSIADRLTALHAWFDSDTELKLLGVIPVGGPPVHSHEHRLVFAVPHLDRAALDDWWTYAQQVQKTLVQPDISHQFTWVSIVLICETADRAALSRLRWRSSEVTYHKPQNGWSSIRFAVIQKNSDKIVSNRAGAPLADLLRAAKP
ncbi:MAG: hypothetical protein KHY77_08000 [Butyricicoccus pullicaecorum]|nr:hypothetical protein [Butyricicoccus pullicaecorum]